MARREEVSIPAEGAYAGVAVELPGQLAIPHEPRGLVVFAHGSDSSRLSPRNRAVAESLFRAGLATLLFDLLTPDEAPDRANVFDIPLLAGRLSAATAWLRREGLASRLLAGDLPIGYFGASTGGGAALWAAADPESPVSAVVSRGGRPDLAGPRLESVRASTLLIVGQRDEQVLELNEQAFDRLRCRKELSVVRGATHLFEEPGALDAVAGLARDWFLDVFSAGGGRDQLG